MRIPEAPQLISAQDHLIVVIYHYIDLRAFIKILKEVEIVLSAFIPGMLESAQMVKSRIFFLLWRISFRSKKVP